MKNTKTTIRELSARYRDILKKCFYLNAVALGLFVATAANAAGTAITGLSDFSMTSGYGAIATGTFLQASDITGKADKADTYTKTESEAAAVAAARNDAQTAKVAPADAVDNPTSHLVENDTRYGYKDAAGVQKDGSTFSTASVADYTNKNSSADGTIVQVDSEYKLSYNSGSYSEEQEKIVLAASNYKYKDGTGAMETYGQGEKNYTDTYTLSTFVAAENRTVQLTGTVDPTVVSLDGTMYTWQTGGSGSPVYTLTADGTKVIDSTGETPVELVIADIEDATLKSVAQDAANKYAADKAQLVSKQAAIDTKKSQEHTNYTAAGTVLANDEALVNNLAAYEKTYAEAKTKYDSDVIAYGKYETYRDYATSLSGIIDSKADAAVVAKVGDTSDFSELGMKPDGVTPITTVADAIYKTADAVGDVDQGYNTTGVLKNLKYEEDPSNPGEYIVKEGSVVQNMNALDAAITGLGTTKLDAASVAADYERITTPGSETTTADVNTYIEDNATKLSTIASTAAMITDVMEDKEAWIGRELGYDTTTTDANTVLKAKGFADQDGNGKVSFVDAVVQNAGDIDALEGRATSLEGRATSLEGRATSLEGRADALETKVGQANTTPDVKPGETGYNGTGLYLALDTEAVARADADKTLANSIAAEETRATGVENGLDARLDVLEGTGEGSVSQAIAETAGDLSGVADLAFFKGKTPTATMSAAQDGTAPSVAELMTNLNDNLSSEFARVDRRISKLETKMEKGLAANNALAGLVPLDHAHRTQISAAMGGYKNNQALAVGAFHYLNDRTLLNAGAAYGGNDSVSYKVGVTFGF